MLNIISALFRWIWWLRVTVCMTLLTQPTTSSWGATLCRSPLLTQVTYTVDLTTSSSIEKLKWMKNNNENFFFFCPDRLFRCRFSTSKFVRRQGSGNKLALVRARCLPPPYHSSSYWTSNPVWVCFCSPLKSSVPQVSSARNPLPTPPAEQSFLLSCFQSQHSRDMRIHAAQDRYSLNPVNIPVCIW